MAGPVKRAVSLPEDLWDEIDQAVKTAGVTLDEWLADAARHHLNHAKGIWRRPTRDEVIASGRPLPDDWGVELTEDDAESFLETIDANEQVAFEKITDTESWDIFNNNARRLLGVSGAELIARWNAGLYDDTDTNVARLAMLRPDVEDRRARADAELTESVRDSSTERNRTL